MFFYSPHSANHSHSPWRKDANVLERNVSAKIRAKVAWIDGLQVDVRRIHHALTFAPLNLDDAKKVRADEQLQRRLELFSRKNLLKGEPRDVRRNHEQALCRPSVPDRLKIHALKKEEVDLDRAMEQQL